MSDVGFTAQRHKRLYRADICFSGRTVTNVMRTCSLTPLLYKRNEICLNFELSGDHVVYCHCEIRQ